jgi:hypothetical protein
MNLFSVVFNQIHNQQSSEWRIQQAEVILVKISAQGKVKPAAATIDLS